MNRMKKILAIILSVMVLMSALPVMSASAEEVYGTLSLGDKTKVKLSGEKRLLSFTPENDGWYAFYTLGEYDTYASLFDSEDNELVYDDDGGEGWNFSLKAYLEAEQTYYISLSAYETEYMSPTVYAYVQETLGVVSMGITSLPYDMTCIEGYEEQSVDFSGFGADFTLSDGSVVNWTFESDIFEICDTQIYFKSEKGENGEFYYNVTCGNATEKLQFVVVENQIERIELELEKPFEFFEDTHGHINELGKFVYYYNIPEGSVLNVYYKDGSTSQVTDFGYRSNIRLTDTQMTTPWELGTNYVTLSYFGIETQFAVEILPCPIESVTVHSAPSREYILGDENWGYMNGVGRYEFWPEDLTGLSFTVQFKDGTTKLFDDSVIDMEKNTIDGYDYEVSSSYTIKPKACPVTLNFMGYEIKYNVNVVESPIRNLEVIWGPENCFYENRYDPILDGTEIRITYTDGTEKVIMMSDENTSYSDNGGLSYSIKDGDIEIDVYETFNEYYQEVYLFNYIDKWTVYEGIYFEDDRGIKNIQVDKFTPDGDKMIVTLTYVDDSTETLTFDTVCLSNLSNAEIGGYAKTENGIASYKIEKVVKNGEIVSYRLSLFGEIIEINNVEFKTGDVDMDGKVSVMDATAIQLHLAHMAMVSEAQQKLADTDNDGKVSVMDATQIQLSIAQLIDTL